MQLERNKMYGYYTLFKNICMRRNISWFWVRCGRLQLTRTWWSSRGGV